VLILVDLGNPGSGSASTSISSISGPFSTTPAQVTSKNYDTTSQAYLFAWQATGNGSSAP
jgi:hypothetical protein